MKRLLASFSITLAASGLIGTILVQPLSAQTACQPHKTLSSSASFTVNTKPEDLAVTPNGRFAIVRGNGQGSRVLAFDLLSNVLVTISGTFSGLGVHAHDADVVEVTNTRAITIGSEIVGVGTVENRTYVDIFALATSPSVSVSVLRSYTFTDFGEAHDIAITPDGTKAVVTGDRRIRVFDLLSPGASPLAVFNVSGSPRWAFIDGNDVLWTDVPADSVQVTNDVAIVQYAQTVSACGSRPQPIVYLLDLNDLSAVALTDDLGADLVAFDGCDGRWPHDLAISPDGSRAVAGGVKSLALYDLTSMTRIDWTGGESGGRAGGLFQTISQTTAGGFPPVNYGTVVDSVAISDSHVVAIADQGGAVIYEIGGGTLNPVQTIAHNGVHDVAILSNGSVAVAHTRNSTHLIDLTTSTPLVTTLADAAGSDARGSTNAFVSDSALLTVTPARCVTINTQAGGSTGSLQIVNTSNGSVVAGPSISLNDSLDRLVDLRAVANFVFVRASDSSSDLFGFNTCTGASMGSFNLGGQCKGVDHLEATSTRVITTSESATGGFVNIFSF